jgi:hypothetical protein
LSSASSRRVGSALLRSIFARQDAATAQSGPDEASAVKTSGPASISSSASSASHAASASFVPGLSLSHVHASPSAASARKLPSIVESLAYRATRRNADGIAGLAKTLGHGDLSAEEDAHFSITGSILSAPDWMGVDGPDQLTVSAVAAQLLRPGGLPSSTLPMAFVSSPLRFDARRVHALAQRLVTVLAADCRVRAAAALRGFARGSFVEVDADGPSSGSGGVGGGARSSPTENSCAPLDFSSRPSPPGAASLAADLTQFRVLLLRSLPPRLVACVLFDLPHVFAAVFVDLVRRLRAVDESGVGKILRAISELSLVVSEGPMPAAGQLLHPADALGAESAAAANVIAAISPSEASNVAPLMQAATYVSLLSCETPQQLCAAVAANNLSSFLSLDELSHVMRLILGRRRGLASSPSTGAADEETRRAMLQLEQALGV